MLNFFTQELYKKPESERTKEFKEEVFKNTKHGHVRCVGRTSKRVALARPALTSLPQEDKEELKKLKNGLMAEKEEIQQMKEEFMQEKEQLLWKRRR